MSTFDFDVIGDPVAPKVIPPNPTRSVTQATAEQTAAAHGPRHHADLAANLVPAEAKRRENRPGDPS